MQGEIICLQNIAGNYPNSEMGILRINFAMIPYTLFLISVKGRLSHILPDKLYYIHLASFS